MRSLPEWIGKTDDTPPSTACKRRILSRQDNCCALTGRPFTAKEKPEFDHKVALWLGGKNSESNLHAIHKTEHKDKTAAEAKVRAKVNGQHDAHFGIKAKTKRPIPSPPKAPKPAPKTVPARKRDVFGRPIQSINPSTGEIGDSHA